MICAPVSPAQSDRYCGASSQSVPRTRMARESRPTSANMSITLSPCCSDTPTCRWSSGKLSVSTDATCPSAPTTSWIATISRNSAARIGGVVQTRPCGARHRRVQADGAEDEQQLGAVVVVVGLDARRVAVAGERNVQGTVVRLALRSGDQIAASADDNPEEPRARKRRRFGLPHVPYPTSEAELWESTNAVLQTLPRRTRAISAAARNCGQACYSRLRASAARWQCAHQTARRVTSVPFEGASRPPKTVMPSSGGGDTSSSTCISRSMVTFCPATGSVPFHVAGSLRRKTKFTRKSIPGVGLATGATEVDRRVREGRSTCATQQRVREGKSLRPQHDAPRDVVVESAAAKLASRLVLGTRVGEKLDRLLDARVPPLVRAARGPAQEERGRGRLVVEVPAARDSRQKWDDLLVPCIDFLLGDGGVEEGERAQVTGDGRVAVAVVGEEVRLADAIVDADDSACRVAQLAIDVQPSAVEAESGNDLVHAEWHRAAPERVGKAVDFAVTDPDLVGFREVNLEAHPQAARVVDEERAGAGDAVDGDDAHPELHRERALRVEPRQRWHHRVADVAVEARAASAERLRATAQLDRHAADLVNHELAVAERSPT
eukprot:4559877-Pleurochrysis_carterae.AAC.1